MFRPRYQIILNKENFYPDDAVCLGSQLVSIIECLKETLKPHIWFAADVDAFSKIPQQLNINSFSLKEVGDDHSIIKLSSQINQFLWGVFLAIDSNLLSQKIDNLEVGTEDIQFRSLAVNGVLIEIRLFDTTFFELYSEEKLYLKKIAKKFNVNIINNK